MELVKHSTKFVFALVGVAAVMAASDLVVRGPDSVWGRAVIYLLTK